MNAPSAAPTAPADPDLPLLPAQIPTHLPALGPGRAGRGWQWWAALGFSGALLIAVILQLSKDGLAPLAEALPTTPLFYLALIGSYAALPTFDWLIFRRLWRLPASGIVPVLKKRVSNDVMFGLAGEAYLYLWARARTNIAAAPFGAVKDVSILSALAGNVMTLALLIAALPMAMRVDFTVDPRLLIGSGAIVVGTSLLMLLLRRRIFSLPRRDLLATFALHMVRITLSTSLLALAWYAALPSIGAETWLLFAALRLLVSRLPLIPSRDLLFAAAAVFLTGAEQSIGPVVAMSAGLFLTANLTLGILLAGSDLFERRSVGATA